jgi:hypothetical protein
VWVGVFLTRSLNARPGWLAGWEAPTVHYLLPTYLQLTYEYLTAYLPTRGDTGRAEAGGVWCVLTGYEDEAREHGTRVGRERQRGGTLSITVRVPPRPAVVHLCGVILS